MTRSTITKNPPLGLLRTPLKNHPSSRGRARIGKQYLRGFLGDLRRFRGDLKANAYLLRTPLAKNPHGLRAREVAA